MSDVKKCDARSFGIERRVAHRRSGCDRRQMIRFNDKGDRRTGKDRRSMRGNWNTRCVV